jgi:hypothetical protein
MGLEEKLAHNWKLQRNFRRLTVVSFLGIAFLPVIGIFVMQFDYSSPLAEIGEVLFFICMMIFLFSILCTVFWPCPRCGKPFVFKRYSSFPFRDKCSHCGLPFGARSIDSETKGKRAPK